MDIENYTVRALTRGEIKALRKDGFNLSQLDQYDNGRVDEIVDAVVEAAMGNQVDNLDREPNAVTLEVFSKIMEETFGGPGESKNSSTPGTGAKAKAPKGAKSAGTGRAKTARGKNRK